MSVHSSPESKRTELSFGDDDIKKWLDSLYDVGSYEEQLLKWYEFYKYKGFERTDVLQDLKNLNETKEIIAQIILVCALNGPKRASMTRLRDGRSLMEMGIPASRKPGMKGISCGRITSATADLAAYYLKAVDFRKRVSSVDCPGWLQFPSAGSIDLPKRLREQHIEFSKAFSDLIGGEFKEDIYSQMVDNAYYNPKLDLF
jgi:hypothetical protein